MVDIRCRSCNAKLAERHDTFIEIKWKRKLFIAKPPVEISCDKCGIKTMITEEDQLTIPQQHAS